MNLLRGDRTIRNVVAVVFALVMAVGAAVVNAEAVSTFYGSTAFGPTYNRPATKTSLSPYTPQHDVLQFWPNESATCSIISAQEGSFHGHIALYLSSFDPANSLELLMAVNDDFSPSDGGTGAGSSAITGVGLTNWMGALLVTSGAQNDDKGNYSVTIICDDPATKIFTTRFGEKGQEEGFKNDRFVVSATWRDFADNTGHATFVPFASGDSGLMSFFSPTNFEVLIKILDACSFNERYRVFYAATTSVEFEITVEDTVADVTKTYRNTLGVSAPAVTDTSAFATCP